MLWVPHWPYQRESEEHFKLGATTRTSVIVFTRHLLLHTQQKGQNRALCWHCNYMPCLTSTEDVCDKRQKGLSAASPGLSYLRAVFHCSEYTFVFFPFYTRWDEVWAEYDIQLHYYVYSYYLGWWDYVFTHDCLSVSLTVWRIMFMPIINIIWLNFLQHGKRLQNGPRKNWFTLCGRSWCFHKSLKAQSSSVNQNTLILNHAFTAQCSSMSTCYYIFRFVRKGLLWEVQIIYLELHQIYFPLQTICVVGC